MFMLGRNDDKLPRPVYETSIKINMSSRDGDQINVSSTAGSQANPATITPYLYENGKKRDRNITTQSLKDYPRKRYKKPKDMPKRPLSAYNLFFAHEKRRILDRQQKGLELPDFDALEAACAKQSSETNENPSAESKKKKVAPVLFQALAKYIGARWRALSEDERKSFKEQAKDELKRYRQKMKEYHDLHQQENQPENIPNVSVEKPKSKRRPEDFDIACSTTGTSVDSFRQQNHINNEYSSFPSNEADEVELRRGAPPSSTHSQPHLYTHSQHYHNYYGSYPYYHHCYPSPFPPRNTEPSPPSVYYYPSRYGAPQEQPPPTTYYHPSHKATEHNTPFTNGGDSDDQGLHVSRVSGTQEASNQVQL